MLTYPTLEGIKKLKKKNKKITNFRLHEETIENLRQLAKANDTSMNKIVEFLINETVEKYNNNNNRRV